MTNPTLHFGPGQPVKKYSAQLPDDQTTFELPNPAGDADATLTLYDSDGEEVGATVTVTAETVRIEVDPEGSGVGLLSRVVLVG